MPPAEKKWDANAERDLCVAIIMGAQDGERMRYNWPKVHSSMEALGYGFTKDAISQHFSKTIMREFKNRHGEPSANNSPAPTPTPKKTPRKRATPAKGRKKKVESDDEDEEAAVESPLVKKMKRKKEEEDEDVKMGNINSTEGGRDSSATPEGDDKFDKWLASDAAAKA